MKKVYIVLIGMAVLLAGAVLVRYWIFPGGNGPGADKAVREKIVKQEKTKKSSQSGKGVGAETGTTANKTPSADESRESSADFPDKEQEGEKSAAEEKPDQTPEDDVVTHHFLQDLAEQVFTHYIPGGEKRGDGRLTLTFRQLNTRYGLNMYGLEPEGSAIRAMRGALFKHLFREDVLNFLADKYTPIFVRDLISVARSTPKTVSGPDGEKSKVVLEDAQIADILIKLAQKIRAVGEIFEVCMEKENLALLRSYIRAEEKVRDAYYAYWQEQKKDGKSRQPGESIKKAISEREQARRDIYTSIAPAEGSAEVVYIAKWAYRRFESGVCGRSCLDTLSRVGRRVAERLEKRAAGL